MSDLTSRSVCSNKACTRLQPPGLGSGAESMDQRWRRHYRKLDHKAREIRLFKITPGSSPDLEGELLYTPIFESRVPQERNAGTAEVGSGVDGQGETFFWRALSYVWGPPPNNSTGYGEALHTEGKKNVAWVRLNGDSLPIRQNLYECLLSLRRHHYFEPIWIDAICINQTDHLERGSQVLMMKEIYRSAGEVVIAIPSAPGQNYQHGNEELSTPTEIFKSDSTLYFAISDWGHGLEDYPYFRRVAEVLRDDHEQSYWNRLWTIQECVFARSLSVINGTLKLSWDELRRVRHTAAMMAIQYQVEGHTPGLTENERQNFLRKTRLLTSASLSNREDLRKDMEGGDLFDVLLRNCAASKCADPRDYIYGLMGVARPPKSPDAAVYVDYSLCTWCVWLNATVSIIRDTETLDVLATSGFGPKDGSIYSRQPSWMPSWGSIEHKRRTSQHQFSLRVARARWHFSPDFRELEAMGTVIGCVTGPHYEPHIASTSDGLYGQQYIGQLEGFLRVHVGQESDRFRCLDDFASLVTEFHTSATPVDAEVARIACTGRVDLLASFDDKVVGSVYSDIAMILLKRQIILISQDSNRPLLGLGDSPHIWQGNTICGIVGCSTPLVVDRNKDGDRIVGICLLPKHARNQVIDEVHNGERSLETFRFI